MIEKLLRDTLKEAKEKEQLGLLIWADWRAWDACGYQIKPGNGSYDLAFSQIAKGEEAKISTEWNGLSMPGFIAVSVKRLSSSEEFFKNVLSICEKGRYKGPITRVPLNELSENF